MTREEAIEYLNTLYMALAVFPNQQISLGNVDEMKESVSMAIEALEQEPILDKIRAEIEENAYPIVHGVNNHEKGMSLYGILQIIDKYKAEVELQENRCADCNHYDVCMSHMKVR